ncbi:hypothetical protein N0V88_007054 [Collariella sp. IMI 366227]|nr:hypothetical protein N0V88_007054 [Collariella sp. IMI 366227]
MPNRWIWHDANSEFTWPSDTFDFIHARVLVGNIVDWRQFYKEAFRCCKPGGWMESHEPSFSWQSDLGIPENSALGQWKKVWWEGGKKFGRTFRVVDDDLQKKYMEEAGFVDIVVKDFKTPVGDWPLDRHQKRIGMWSKTTLMTDIEGYILYIWNAVMGWSREEVLVYIAHVKLQLRTKNLNPWFTRRLVYGRKPE